ncbi:hypothetical protein B0189_08805 [Moraxella cuniculi]|nr:hypothetical protein B0189_08805 [Moraxella cuniculi]
MPQIKPTQTTQTNQSPMRLSKFTDTVHDSQTFALCYLIGFWQFLLIKYIANKYLGTNNGASGIFIAISN